MHPDFALRALVTYTRNDVVDYIEVICKNEAGTKIEPYFSRKEIILSASWKGPCGNPVMIAKPGPWHAAVIPRAWE